MKIKKLVTLTAIAVLTENVYGQTENLLQGWDGTGCEIQNPKPSDFGWSSNQSVTWGTLDATDGSERFVTKYDSYTTWDGSKITDRENPNLSTKLLYLHFAKDRTYTYTFKGLTPGHAYRFTGLSAWHDNDNTNKGKCNVSIASDNMTYISIYTEAQTKKKFYPMQATFIVPATETAEEFKMVIGNGNSTSMLSLSGIGLYDLGEVPYPDYNTATNLDFSSAPLEDGVSTYIRNYNGTTIKKAQMQPVDGWYFTGRTGDCTAGGVMTYGSGNWVGAETNTVPSTNPNGVKSGNALAVVAVWSGSVNYIRPVTFPAGTYSLSIPVYNQAGTTALSKNLIGFVDMEGNEYYANTKNYTEGKWTTEIIKLEFDKDTEGYLSIGYTATNTGNANVQHLFVDGITIQSISELDKAKADLNSLIDEFTMPETNVGDDAFQYPTQVIEDINTALDAAQAVYEDENATIDDVNAQIAIVSQLTLPALNGPEENVRYKICVTADDFVNDKGINYIVKDHPITFKAGGQSTKDKTDTKYDGYYSLTYEYAYDKNYGQAFQFIPVEGENDIYKISFTGEDGETCYMATQKGAGYQNSSDVARIRVTEDKDKALKFKVVATSEEGVWNLLNTETKNNTPIGVDDYGVYTRTNRPGFNIAPAEQTEATLKIVKDVKYGTFIAPFKADKPENVTLYSVKDVNESTLTLEKATEIAANTPYIVYEDVEETITYPLQGYGTAYNDTYKAGLLEGTLAGGEMTLGADCYLLQKNNDVVGFYQCVAGQTYKLGANRAYLKYKNETSASVKAFFFGEENQTTAITTLSELMNGKAEIYDLNGRKLRKLEKGINIVNGKKVIIK